MLAIDADAHVIETDHTWDYLEGRDKRFARYPSPWTCPKAGRATTG